MTSICKRDDKKRKPALQGSNKLYALQTTPKVGCICVKLYACCGMVEYFEDSYVMESHPGIAQVTRLCVSRTRQRVR